LADICIKQKRTSYRRALERGLEQILQRLQVMPEVSKVIQFGSFAAGRRDLFTDLDLIVIMETEQEIVQRTASLYQKLQVGVDMDLLVYTPEEFRRMSTHGFVRHALQNGQVTYEKKRA
jgi:predicted nucleotidyltransferase